METRGPTGREVSVSEWLDRVRVSLASSADLTLTSAEQRVLLDLARTAAHRSERIAAPLSTYLVGLALGGLSPEARAKGLADLIRDLEASSD